MTASLALIKELPHLLLLVASLPFLMALPSGTDKVIALCLSASVFTVLLSHDPYRASLAWFVGMLIAALALHERYRAI